MLIAMDLDGVLVDACDWHKDALARAMEEVLGFHISDEDHRTIFNGLPTRKKLAMLQIKSDQANVICELKQRYTMDMIRSRCQIDYDKIGLMTWLIYHGHRLACVTNSVSETAWTLLDRLGIAWYFHKVVSNQDIVNPKPHPEGYLKAINDLGYTPDMTIIVEDSPHGIAAARATGAQVIEVANATEVNIKLLSKYL